MAKFNRKGHKNLSIAEQYEKYLEQFYTRLSSARARGIETPIDRYGLGDEAALTFEEFSYALQEKKTSSRGVSTTNLIREIVSEQIYFHSQKEAKAIQEETLFLGIKKDDGSFYSIRELRTGVGKNLLSQINEMIKASGMASGTDRAKYISYYIFDSL